jgi:immunity protein, SdpI family
MTRTTLAIASLLVVATMVVAALAVGSSVPGDLPLPIHWGLNGEPDRFSDKWTALLLPSGFTAGVSLLFYFLPSLEPRREGLERSQGLYLWGWVALLLMGAVIELALVALALRWPVHANHLIVGGLGAMLILIGNQLGKSRSMYLIGLRTPWTLASEDVWMRTHRLAGKLMVGGGLLMIAAAALPIPSGPLATVMLGVIAVAAGVPIVYSFVLWRRERAAQPSE